MLSVAQVNQKYGNPDPDSDGVLNLDWANANLVVIRLPYPLRLSWDPQTSVIRVQCHKLFAANLINVLKEISTRVSPQKLRNMALICGVVALISDSSVAAMHFPGIHGE